MRLLKLKTEMIFLIIAIFLALIILISNIIFRNPNKSSDQNTQQLNNLFISISPDTKTFLTPGNNLSFKIALRNKLESIPEVDTQLIDTDILGGTQKDIPFKQELSKDKLSLVIYSEARAVENHNYRLIIKAPSNGMPQILFDNLYLVAKAQTQATNNKALSSYLPFETKNYILSYLADKNLYVFNFKFDLNSPESASLQFEKAKQDATAFIKSKGIDPASLTIEWRQN